MGYQLKRPIRRQCDECGAVYLQRDRRRLFCSPMCSFERSKEVARQIAIRSGPYYDRWREGMRIAAERE